LNPLPRRAACRRGSLWSWPPADEARHKLLGCVPRCVPEGKKKGLCTTGPRWTGMGKDAFVGSLSVRRPRPGASAGTMRAPLEPYPSRANYPHPASSGCVQAPRSDQRNCVPVRGFRTVLEAEVPLPVGQMHLPATWQTHSCTSTGGIKRLEQTGAEGASDGGQQSALQ
jgi:hypothetical protein